MDPQTKERILELIRSAKAAEARAIGPNWEDLGYAWLSGFQSSILDGIRAILNEGEQ